MKKPILLILCAAANAFISGCDSKKAETNEKPPRPVSVLELLETDPRRLDRYPGNVVSWKTNQLAFEVSGRVEFVVEPETNITGDVQNAESGIFEKGTELARINSERYELSVASARAAIATTQKQREAALIELDRVIPAQQEAAQAKIAMTKVEVTRDEKLISTRAISQRDLDIARTQLADAVAFMKQLDANREVKRAEIDSLDAQIEELNQTLKQAERDLANCHLFWSVPGQIAKTHVIAGSYVQPGQPVVTVQMMHPIKVEIEVAAATARTLSHYDQVKVFIPKLDGSIAEQLAIIYTIDPLADPDTRTITITLMLSNSVLRDELPKDIGQEVIAITDTLGTLIQGFGAKPDALFVNESYIDKDDAGDVIWKVVNRRGSDTANNSLNVLEVQKVRVVVDDTRIPVLGLAVLREVKIADGQEFDPEVDVITGKIVLAAEGDKSWPGDRVYLAAKGWEVRPGDLVSVDLPSHQTQTGFYVPIDAITEKSGVYYIFVVQPVADGDTVRQLQVTLHDPIGTLRRIEPVEGQQFAAGDRIVASGATFLVDGERINITEEVEVRR